MTITPSGSYGAALWPAFPWLPVIRSRLIFSVFLGKAEKLGLMERCSQIIQIG